MTMSIYSAIVMVSGTMLFYMMVTDALSGLSCQEYLFIF